ncbi:MAG: division/cell wall cluster transcriptional repressor MraZ [Nocardioides sp.]
MGRLEWRCPMFVGSYTPRLDEKNRLILPAKFREQLAEGLVVTKGQDFCLNVFPIADFANEARRVQEAPLTVRQAREYGRFLAMRAAEDTPDKQGRITIPPLLKEYAGLDREVVVIGALSRVEIWDPARIAAWENEHSQTFADMSEDILPAT